MPRRHHSPQTAGRLPWTRGSSGRAAVSLALLALSAWSASGSTEAAPRGPDQLKAGLTRAVLEIRKSFVDGSAGPMLPLIPQASKVFLSVGAIAGDRGFYSRDQLQALLERSFSQRKTLAFQVRLDRIRGVEEGAEVTICPALWTFDRSGKTSEVKLRFVLSHRSGRWILEEIREIH